MKSMDDFFQYMEKLTPEQKAQLSTALNHSWSFCTFEGEHISHGFEKENLFDVVFRQKKARYIVDSNINWKAEAAKTENRDKAFIICRTISDENPNTRALLFNGVNYENKNLFIIGTDYLNGENPNGLMLERFDEFWRAAFDEKKLAAPDMLPEVIEWEKQHTENLQKEMRCILAQLNIESLAELLSLPQPRDMMQERNSLQDYITQNAPKCVLNFDGAVFVSRACYALLLVEQLKERHKFAKNEDVNIFNDTQILMTALLMNGHLLTEDRGLRRLGRYAGIQHFKNVP